MPLRPRDAAHQYQENSIEYLYNRNSALALMPVGSGKTFVGWTAATELMADGYVKRPIVFAPRLVAINEWPGQREDWEHLKDVDMVNWAGEPSSWPDSLWKKSRLFWGQRTHAENRLPNVEANLTAKNDKAKADGKPYLDAAALRLKIRSEQSLLKELITGLKAQEKSVNKQIHNTEHPELLHCTSYENLEWFCELYPAGTGPFDLWIFDEIGKLRNPTSPRYKMIAKRTKKVLADDGIVWGLNATPAPEGMLDLFTQVKIVDGGQLWGDSFYKWRDQYFTPADYMGYSFRPQMGAKKILLEELNKVAFRVDEKDLSYLKTMQHGQIKVTLPPKAREAYMQMEKTLELQLAMIKDKASPDETIVALSAAAASSKLRQLTQGFIYDEDGKATIVHEEKANALSDLIDSLNGEPLLVAYDFKEDLEAIKRIWKKVPFIGSGVSPASVKQHISDWNARRLPVLAIHPQSAGHGLNLQHGGSHIAWYALPWALELFLQANGRIDRQGQLQACFAHHIVVRNSMDQRVSDALSSKDAEQRSIIQAIRRVR